ncbi:hypothetical protein JCM9140_1916 [Halalkalibacter wakoensis JCM 9140]|uniref:Phage shock protein A n=1 Tax=Halalkalibacter wakoensis JCM 9140 TaxID=1236970 RepID=W4Q1Q9_9BACI|nr:PspA/IM30 family protein [Halalkalibacter wakoensis]GAE25895.1 hypothetical protein JCM9140_1916 [Halalkalibacter wakoensis JCM 9140]
MLATRLNQIMKAYINEGLERIEDPAIMVKQYMRDVGEQVEKAERDLLKLMKKETQLQEELNMAQQLIKKREEQAELAIKADNEELARRILFNKKEVWNEMKQIEQHSAETKKKIPDKEAELEQLQLKYDQLQERQMELIVRVKGVKENERITAKHEETTLNSKATVQKWEKVQDIDLEIEKLKAKMQADG